MIERGELEKSETDATPIPKPTKKILAESSELFDKIINKNGEMSVVDDFVNRLYGVYDYEIQLIEEAIEITYDYYSQRSNSKAVRRLEKIELQQYGDILKKTLLNTIGNQANLSISVLAEDAPLNIVCLDFDDGGNNDYLIPNVEAALNALDKILIEERSQGVFVRRNVRLYRDKKIYIIKPNQYRYWSISSAFKDADEICFDILHGSR
jgi:hypothetical protein